MKEFLNNLFYDKQRKFIIGIILLVLGLYMLVKNMYVATGRYPAMITIGKYSVHSGILTLPLIFALVLLFFRPKSKIAKGLSIAGVLLIVVYAILNVSIRVGRIPMIQWVLLLFMLALGFILTLAGVYDWKIEIK